MIEMRQVYIKALVVDDDEDEYVLISDLLSEISGVNYDLNWAPDYDSALDFYSIERSEVMGKLFWELPFITDNSYQALQTKQGVLDAANGKFVRFEAERQYGQKKKIYIGFSVKPVKGDSGAVVYLIVEARDITKYKEALTKVKRLEGILPICSFCSKVRDEDDKWSPIDSYIHERTEAQVSHSICPDCAQEHYPDLKIYDDKNGDE